MKLVSKLGNRKWKDIDEVEKVLGADMYKDKLVSPKQAEELGYNVDDLVERPENKLVVPASDPRPDINEVVVVDDDDFEDIGE